MKLTRIVCALLACVAALGAWAQGGYQDGIDYYNADRFDKAKIILTRTLNEAGTDKAVAYYYLGCIDLREGNRAAALQNFNAGVAADERCPYNYVGLGEIDLLNGDKRAAEQRFDQALRINRKDADVSTAIARAFFNVDPTLYARDIDKYIAKALKDSKNKAPSVYVLQGDIAAANGNVGEAASFYEQAIVYEEEAGNVNPEAYVKYAKIYNRVNNAYSIAKLEELKSKLPTSALAQSELAEQYYAAQMFRKAATQYEEYMQNPNHFQQDEQRFSLLLYYDDRYPESLALAKNVLSQDPSNFYMYRMVMLNDAKLQNWAEAEEYAKKLFATPNVELSTLDYNTYSDILTALGRPADAIAVLERGYNADPAKNRDMLQGISALYIDTEDIPNAVKYMQMFVDSGDSRMADRFNLARLYGALATTLPEGSAERVEAANKGIAILDADVASAAAESQGAFYYNRARLLTARDGSEPTPELMSTYNQMMEAYGNDASKNVNAFRSAYLYQVLDFAAKGDKAAAREAYNKLATLDPNHPSLEQLDRLTR